MKDEDFAAIHDDSPMELLDIAIARSNELTDQMGKAPPPPGTPAGLAWAAAIPRVNFAYVEGLLAGFRIGVTCMAQGREVVARLAKELLSVDAESLQERSASVGVLAAYALNVENVINKRQADEEKASDN